MTEKPRNRPDPVAELANAADLLTSRNLNNLWRVASILSSISAFDVARMLHSGKVLLAPTLNYQIVSMLCRAIIQSYSTPTKSKLFSGDDLAKIYLSLVNATDFEFYSSSIDIYSERLRFFSKLLNSQLRYQDAQFMQSLGRAYVLFSVIPSESQNELQIKTKRGYIDVSAAFFDTFGLSIQEYLMCAMSVYVLYLERIKRLPKVGGDKLEELLARVNREGRTKIQFDIVCKYINNATSLGNVLCFTHSALVPTGQATLSERMSQRFLENISRTTTELRKYINDNEDYKTGELTVRRHPLERFPIIRLENDLFIVPDLSAFLISVFPRIRYALRESADRKKLNDVYGHVQEIYMNKVLAYSSLRNHVIIPEKEYTKNRSPFKGPDFTIVDQECNGIILIESKAKIVSVDTRVEPAGESFEEDMEASLEAMAKLEAKLQDMYNVLPEYAEYQEVLNTTKGKPPIFVAVVSEGTSLMQEIFWNKIRLNPHHPLHNHENPLCILDIRLFELLIEFAQDNQGGIYRILWEYWEDGKEFRYNPLTIPDSLQITMAESFRNRKLKRRESVANEYASMLLDQVR